MRRVERESGAPKRRRDGGRPANKRETQRGVKKTCGGGAGKMGRQASGLPPRARHAGAGKGCHGREKSDALRGVVI